jgi:hypothetical protein
MPEVSFAIPGLMEMQTPVSDNLPVFLALAPHKFTDALWVGIPTAGPVFGVDDAPGIALVGVTMLFERESPFCNRDAPLELTVENSGVTITDAVAGMFSVPPQPLPLAPGTWRWSIRVATSSSDSTTIYEGNISVTE